MKEEEKFKFKQIKDWSFSKLDKEYRGSGIYMMVFPNHQRYLGKSVHINRRLREHFRDFSFSSDWHDKARESFTQLKLFLLPEVLDNPSNNERDLMTSYAKEKYPHWKRLTKERKKNIYEEYLKPLYDEYQKSVEQKEVKEKEYTTIYYNMACDFFKRVKLWVWEVDENQLTEAENLCLNQIAAEGKKDKYYNTIYPRQINGGEAE